MSISRKIAGLQIVLIISFIAVVLFMGQLVWGRNYLELEQADVKDNVTRTALAWEEELNFLGSLVGDWSPWDDLFAFANNPGGSDFAEKNLQEAQMANLKVNIAMVVGPNGKLIFAKSIDLEHKTENAVPIEAIEHASKLINENIVMVEEDQPVKAFVIVDDRPLLFAMQRILTSDKKGPSPGVFIFAKFADEALLSELSKRTQVKVSWEEDGTIAGDCQEGTCYQQVSENVIKSYYALQDAYGNKSFLVSTTPRFIYQQGLTQMKSFLLFTILFGVISICITLLFLNRMVFARVRKMDAFMNSIVTGNDFSTRLELPGNDELSKSAATMNNMLSNIEASQKKIKDLLEEVGAELDERRKVEESLRYLSMHDPLTGLYNRAYFKHEISGIVERQECGVGIVCCDLDGLKLLNDTMGHHVGDQVLVETAKILRTAFSNEIIARIGGDEFAVIVLNTDEKAIQEACQKIRDIEITNLAGIDVRLNFSCGWAYFGGRITSEDKMNELIKQADDWMYRQKLSSSQSNRNTLVHGMLELLKVRDFITEGHSQRMQHYAVCLGKMIGLKDPQIADLSLLAQFHDIGKVGISDTILFKPGPLTPEERKEMERHSELGQRIVQTIPELMCISDLILKHHEWWNGKGYPLGLQGTEIPIEDRILALVDAFDAMTNSRPYRQAMGIDDAIGELRRCAGVQFDPDLVEKFVGLILDDNAVAGKD